MAVSGQTGVCEGVESAMGSGPCWMRNQGHGAHTSQGVEAPGAGQVAATVTGECLFRPPVFPPHDLCPLLPALEKRPLSQPCTWPHILGLAPCCCPGTQHCFAEQEAVGTQVAVKKTEGHCPLG